MNSTVQAWVIAIATLMPAYTAAGIVGYWMLFDNDPPLHVDYVHPKFLSEPASSREDAHRHEIDVVNVGERIYYYEEYCLKEGHRGIIYRRWIDGFVLSLPERPTIGVAGCYKRSWPVTAPVIPAYYSYRQEIVYRLNPLRDTTVYYPAIDVTVIRPGAT